jgi:hypothetical protein
MNLNRTIQQVQKIFKAWPQSNRPDHALLQLLKITLYNNDFDFNGKTYLQICGVPMGRVFSPSLANIYLQEFDAAAVQGIDGLLPLLYCRFLDDIFFLWPGPLHTLTNFETHLNTLIPGISITLKSHPLLIDFLDTTVFKFATPLTTRLHTKVFFKPTATHQLLHSLSFHPPHTRKGVLKSQLIRFRNISTNYADFIHTCNLVFKTLRTRGYSARMLRTARNKIWNTFGHQPLHTRQNPQNGLIPLVLPFNSLTTKLIRNWREIIQQNPTFSQFTIIAAYSNNRNLANHLVRSKLLPLPSPPN